MGQRKAAWPQTETTTRDRIRAEAQHGPRRCVMPRKALSLNKEHNVARKDARGLRLKALTATPPNFAPPADSQLFLSFFEPHLDLHAQTTRHELQLS